MNIRIVPVGGRIKAAAVGTNHLYPASDIVDLENRFKVTREHPFRELLLAFFPSSRERIKQVMQGVGFFRSVLKTDQGMAGNFLPFKIDLNCHVSDLSTAMINQEEVVAVAEAWANLDPNVIHAVQEQLYAQDFRNAAMTMAAQENRRAEKGRQPFFLIRPAKTDREIILGSDIVERVEKNVANELEKLIHLAEQTELAYCGTICPPRILYFQPDVYVLRNGKVLVDCLNFPDVGCFLTNISDQKSQLLVPIKAIACQLTSVVSNTVRNTVPCDSITLLTRDEVLMSNEDILELTEIEVLKKQLTTLGFKVNVCAIGCIEQIPHGSHVLLFNLDYAQKERISMLLDRHCAGTLICYPNPFVQLSAKRMRFLPKKSIPVHLRQIFLDLLNAQPKNESALRTLWKRILGLLEKEELSSNFLHAHIGQKEVVPIFQPSLFSWHQLSRRASKYDSNEEIDLYQLPNPDQLIVASNTGPRLHAFRFMCVNI